MLLPAAATDLLSDSVAQLAGCRSYDANSSALHGTAAADADAVGMGSRFCQRLLQTDFVAQLADYCVCMSCCRCSDVTDLIKATPETDILRRDINDRPPIL